jgi:SAM-dependent methyltransferase
MLWECGACKAQFWWPLKNPGAEWYTHDERYAGSNADPVWSSHWYHERILSRIPDAGRVLDVGCGNGNFLVSARKVGWDCYGIDINPVGVEAGKTKFGLPNLEPTDLITYTRTHSDRQFDLVTFFDVLEHLDNHNEFIEAVRSLLGSGGYVAMSMPYRKHAEWLMPLDLPPRHLTRWDRAALRTFLEARGFEVVSITRHTDGLWPIILKLRFRYGRLFSFGAVDVVRRSLETGSGKRMQKRKSLLVRATEFLAKVKDACLFGLPAILIWLAMLPTPRRYRTLYAIARKV